MFNACILFLNIVRRKKKNVHEKCQRKFNHISHVCLQFSLFRKKEWFTYFHIIRNKICIHKNKNVIIQRTVKKVLKTKNIFVKPLTSLLR